MPAAREPLAERARRPRGAMAAGGPAGEGVAVSLEAALAGGEEVTTPAGKCFYREMVLPASHRHGRYRLEAALAVRPDALRWLAAPAPVTCEGLAEAVFLDVETTGLAGGTGTLAFLVGLAWFAGASLVLRQYLMRDPAEEAALLDLVAEQIAGRSAIVSFNGRSFDLPLLQTRFVLARRRPALPRDHIDLLAGARRVWRRRLVSCRLARLEQKILGVQRGDDIPGWLVPRLYRDYLQTGDGQALLPVFDHNAGDVLSMVTLAGRLGGLYTDPQAALADDPLDLVALGVALEAHGRRTTDPALAAAAMGCYAGAIGGGTSAAGDDAGLRLAMMHKRQGRWAPAVAAWRRLAVAASGPVRPQALLELAKWAEHRARDVPQALDCTETAARLLAGDDGRPPEHIRRRLARLRAKADRHLRQTGGGASDDPPGA